MNNNFFLQIVTIVSICLVDESLEIPYVEPLDELLIQCNTFQYSVSLKNRTVHECEKVDLDGDYKYFIVPMKSRYSKRDFICGFFLKSDDAFVDVHVMFSHADFNVAAVSFAHRFVPLSTDGIFHISARH